MAKSDLIDTVVYTTFFSGSKGSLFVFKFEIVEIKTVFNDGSVGFSFKVNLYEGKQYLETVTGITLAETILRAVRRLHDNYKVTKHGQ